MKTRLVLFALVLDVCELLFACGAREAIDRAVEPPVLAARVNDTANVLRDDERARLESELHDYEVKTGHQFVLLTVPTLGGVPAEQYAERVFSTWKLGDTERDDGLLFVLAVRDRKTRIEVGYGLEGAIPDVVAKRALDDARPAFRAGEWAAGIETVFAKLKAAAEDDSRRSRPKIRPIRCPARSSSSSL